jgi:hypothetical protein
LPGLQKFLTWKGSGQERTRQDIQKDSLTQEGNDKTHREGQQADGQLAKFYFSQQVLYKRGET